MNLHDIRPGGIRAWLWGFPLGGNNTVLGRGQYKHIYEIERATPPPLGQQQRNWWEPWPIYFGDANLALNPLCGRITTTARFPRLRLQHWRWAEECPNCAQIAAARGITADVHARHVTNDPWTALNWMARQNTPDPLTGL